MKNFLKENAIKIAWIAILTIYIIFMLKSRNSYE
jgi:hypothetical protein